MQVLGGHQVRVALRRCLLMYMTQSASDQYPCRSIGMLYCFHSEWIRPFRWPLRPAYKDQRQVGKHWWYLRQEKA